MQKKEKRIFREDAHFQLARIAYRQGAFEDVLKHGELFSTELKEASLPRIAQVKLLCANVRLSAEGAPEAAWQTASPLAAKRDELSPQSGMSSRRRFENS